MAESAAACLCLPSIDARSCCRLEPLTWSHLIMCNHRSIYPPTGKAYWDMWTGRHSLLRCAYSLSFCTSFTFSQPRHHDISSNDIFFDGGLAMFTYYMPINIRRGDRPTFTFHKWRSSTAAASAINSSTSSASHAEVLEAQQQHGSADPFHENSIKYTLGTVDALLLVLEVTTTA